MKRSRSPLRFTDERDRNRFRRSFSISSLSSCSIGQDDKTYQTRELHRDEDRGRDKFKHSSDKRNTKDNKRSRQNKNNHRNSAGFVDDVLDPSICDFERNTRSAQENVTIDLRKNSGDDKLERLEKMVELLVTNRSLSSTAETVSEPREFPTGELIPRNTNFTTSMWLNKINEECLNRNFDEKTCIQFATRKMTGIIKAWFKTINEYDYTWPELKMLITKMFPDNTDFAATLRLLVDRVKAPDESITQYYFSKMYLLEACKITGNNAVSCIINGLNNVYLQQEALAKHFLTPETLYSQYLIHLPNRIMNLNELHSEREVILQDYIPETEVRTCKQQTPIVEFVNKKCFTCGRFGHIAESCRHAPLCYICRKTGHIAAKCPN